MSEMETQVCDLTQAAFTHNDMRVLQVWLKSVLWAFHANIQDCLLSLKPLESTVYHNIPSDCVMSIINPLLFTVFLSIYH